MFDCVNGKTVMKKEHQEKKYQVSFKVSGGDIENIMVAALADGASNLVRLDCTRQSCWSDKPAWLTAPQFATQIIIEGGTVLLNDINDSIVYHELTLRKLLNGINDFINSAMLKKELDNIEEGKAESLLSQLSGADASEIIANAIFERRH